jgi:hypothetical protein
MHDQTADLRAETALVYLVKSYDHLVGVVI